MAMATPAPLGRSRNNEFVADAAGPSSPSQHQPQHQLPYHQPVPARRILKTSKSVDGLRRARSHTADPTSQSLRRDFEGLYMNSPSLTQTQLDAYGGNNSSDNYNSNNNGHYQPQGLTPSRSLHRNGGNQNGNVFDPRGESRSRNHSQNQQQQDQQGLAPSQPGSTQSPYQTLHVQASQIASRSTPKLTLFTQPVSQSHYTNESKETRSFNGLPGQLDSKPKPKSSRLKPIVAVEKADDEHVERYVYYVTVVSFLSINPTPEQQ
ncbi:hypothetical protein F5H01DRAFT_60918 [Linnemannia elongata]|nr:hypothetical protein F5H01DRAFT_60918 [Linnemannia elongata]